MGVLGVQPDAIHRSLVELPHPGLTCAAVSSSRQEYRLSCRKKGRGIALFRNDKWCNLVHTHVKELRCTRDIEMPAVSLRPYYLPREFSSHHNNNMPPLLGQRNACELLHSAFLSARLLNVHQYIKCRTRDKKILCMICCMQTQQRVGAYNSKPLPPLGCSQVHPVYTPVGKRQPP